MIVVIAQFVLAFVFLFAALSKIFSLTKFRAKIKLISPRYSWLIGNILITQEILIAVFAIFNFHSQIVISYIILLLSAYTAYLYHYRNAPANSSCACFGIDNLIKAQTPFPILLIRNIFLILLAIYAIVFDSHTESIYQILSTNYPFLPYVVLLIFILFSGQVLALDRLKFALDEIDDINSIIDKWNFRPKPGLHLNKAIESINLEDCKQDEIDIGSVLDNEKGTLVFFFSEGCTACKDVIPTLDDIAKTNQKSFSVVAILYGSPQFLYKLCADIKFRNIFLDKDNAFTKRINIAAFPSATYVDKDGKVFSDNAMGPIQIKHLIEHIAQNKDAPWLFGRLKS